VSTFLWLSFAIPFGLIFLYGIGQLYLAIIYFKGKKHRQQLLIQQPQLDWANAPIVTIQLPIYNEQYVVEGLIDSVAKMRYPQDKLEIQVLDDSTDETVEIIAKKVAYWQTQGIDIQHIRRTNRVGYKAGALAYGMEFCKGEYIAIFDADFRPQEEWLEQTMPYFDDEKIGVVQTRWSYTNENDSILTKILALMLHAHFTIEQMGRDYANHFFNFNGTAGIWRKTCIYDAGGWEADTLTEDLDLSYRAQMKGWEFRYIPHIHTPSELPDNIPAIKSQQFRWMKGAAECTKKIFFKIWRSKNVSLGDKLQATFHFFGCHVFICTLIMGLVSVPLLVWLHYHPEQRFIMNYVAIGTLGFVFVTLCFGIAYRYTYREQSNWFFKFVWQFFMFMSFSTGLSLHNGLAVLEGYSGKKTPFMRTPKFGDKNGKKSGLQYLVALRKPQLIAEMVLFIYFLTGLILGIWWNDTSLLFFHAFLSFGYGMLIYHSFKKVG